MKATPKPRPSPVSYNLVVDTTDGDTRGIGLALMTISEQLDHLIQLLEGGEKEEA